MLAGLIEGTALFGLLVELVIGRLRAPISVLCWRLLRFLPVAGWAPRVARWQQVRSAGL